MPKDKFERFFEGLERYYQITKLANDNAKIGNLAFEELNYYILIIIKDHGLNLLKEKIKNLKNRKLQQRLLVLLTPFDLDFAKGKYKEYLDNKIPEYLENQPMAWNHFVDPNYLNGALELVRKINEKRKVGLTIRDDY